MSDNPALDAAMANAAKSKGPDEQPPKKPAAKKPAATRAGTKAALKESKDAEILEQLEAFYATIGLAISIVHPSGGQAIVEQAGSAASGWLALSEKNTKLRATLEKSLEVSAWSGVVVAHVPIALAFLPEGFFPGGAILPGFIGGFREDAQDGSAPDQRSGVPVPGAEPPANGSLIVDNLDFGAGVPGQESS